MMRTLDAALKAALLVAACGLPGQALAADSLQLDGSTTVGPIADAFAEYFMKHRQVKVTVKKTGSGDGAAALLDGRCDIADMSRFMKDKEFKAAVEKGIFPVAHVVALDGVCVIVHPSNPVKDLTVDQIRKIYTNEITDWKDVGGAPGPIVALSRDSSSGTFETFEGLVMNKAKMGKVEYTSSNPDMHARVSNNTNAVGYVGLGFVDAKVKAVKVNDILPTRKTIASGVYPIARPLFMFTNGYPKLGSAVYAFVTFHLSEKGQEIVESKGFVPVTDY